jgi:hypothetical protein
MGITGVLIAIQLLSLLFFYFSLPPLLPLFNQMPWGESRLGTKMAFFIPSGTMLFFFFLNFFLLSHWYERMPLISRILCITTLLIAILSLIFTMHTLYIII